MHTILLVALAACGQAYSPVKAYRTDTWRMLYLQPESEPIYDTVRTPYSTTGCWCAMCRGNGSSGYTERKVCVNSPSPLEEAESIMRCLQVGTRDILYDVGCGDGRLCVLASKEFGARSVGLDLRPEAVALSQANARRSGVEELTRFYVRDCLNTRISQATIVMAYLPPETINQLAPTLQQYENLQIAVSYRHPWPVRGNVEVSGWHFWRLRGEPVTMEIKRAKTEREAADRQYALRVWSADWCSKCSSREWLATLDRFGRLPGVSVQRCDFDRYRTWCAGHGITALPTVELFEFRGDEPVQIGSKVGVTPYEQLVAMIDRN